MSRAETWNLVLAVLPVALGYALAWSLGRKIKQPYLKLLIGLPLAAAWLACLPNTCYLLTDWRHLLMHRPWGELLPHWWSGARYAMLPIAEWVLYFLLYAGAGVLLLVLAVRPVEQWLRSSGKNPAFAAPFLFFAVSLGVYLSLFSGFHTLDLFRRPMVVAHSTRGIFANTPLLISIGVFGALLWALYEGGDIWVEGMASRIQRLRAGGKKGSGETSRRAKKEPA